MHVDAYRGSWLSMYMQVGYTRTVGEVCQKVRYAWSPVRVVSCPEGTGAHVWSGWPLAKAGVAARTFVGVARVSEGW